MNKKRVDHEAPNAKGGVGPSKMPRVAPGGGDDETLRLLRDLHRHQVELEKQNEELRTAQRALQNSLDRYQALFELAPVGYVVADSTGMVRQANQTLAGLLGMKASALNDQPFGNLIHPEDRDTILARFEAFFKAPGSQQIEARLLKSDGGALYVRMEGRRITPEAATTPGRQTGHLLIAIRDITQTKSAEQAILRAKEQWEQTFDAVPDLIAIIDEQYNLVRVNRALARRLELTPQACVGRKCYHLLHEKGERPESCTHQRFFETGHPWEAEGFNAKLNGHFIMSVSPFKTSEIDAGWSIHVFHDITDRIRAEKELLKSRNLESIGNLAGGMAHDFNNILTALVGQIDLAKLQPRNPAKSIFHMNKSLEAAFRARDLANRLLTFAEGGTPRMASMRIDHLIEQVAQENRTGSAINITLDLPNDLQPLVIDASQMHLAIQNIIANAREAMPAGGRLSISARNIERSTQGTNLPPGSYVQINFTDQGSGIAAEHLDQIFDPYFSTKQMGSQRGVGLGLTITHSIVRRHNGHIAVHSTPGQGTTVTVYLPLPSAADEDTLADVACPSPATRRLLVMDDEEIIWDVIEPVVQHMGYEVDFTAGGETALALYRQALRSGNPYTAAILDLTIPGGMGGKEVIQKLLEIDPQAKAAVLSGYSTDEVFSNYQQFGFSAALKKPFHIGELKALVAQLMSGETCLPVPT